MNSEPLVSIIICTHNRVDALERYAFASLQHLTYTNVEIIVVDDASTDNTKEIVDTYKSVFCSLHYIHNAHTRGLCFVRNLGITHARGDIVAFIDDDCSVMPDWLEKLVSVYVRDTTAVCVGGKSYVRDTQELYNPPHTIYGCNMSFRREIFDTFLFDTNIYFNKSSNYDEIDLIHRLKDAGLGVVYTDTAIVHHYYEHASYRKNATLGEPLNLVYLLAKESTLKDYYYFAIQFVLFSVFAKHETRQESKMRRHFKELEEALYSSPDLRVRTYLWVYSLVLFIIPLKAYTAPKSARSQVKTVS